MEPDTGIYIVTGNDANLILGPHIERPAYYPCGQAGKAGGFDINCSLVCYLGRPFISGMITLNTYLDSCETGAPLPTYGYNPNEFYISVGCSPNYDPETILNSQWVGSTIATTSHFTAGYGYKLRFDAILTVNLLGDVSISIATYRLMPAASPYWTICNTATFTMNMVTDGYDTRTYESDIIAVAFNQANCTNEVKYMKARLVLDAYKFGCSISDTANAKKCALYSTRSGNLKSYSCLICLVTPSTRHAWNPQVIQLGYNVPGCGMASRCGCWEYDGFTLDPPDSSPSELLLAGCPNESPSSNLQQIQFGIGGKNSSGNNYKILLKTINRTGDICVAAKLSGASTWVIGTLTFIQDINPFIALADFTGLLADNPMFYFYGMEFPTASVLGCLEGFGISPRARDIKTISPAARDIKPAKVKSLISRMADVKKSPCVHLGMALETEASCGCSGGLLHSCSIHGKCRIAGNTIEMNCWRCDSYTPKPEALDGPSVDKLSGPPDSI